MIRSLILSLSLSLALASAPAFADADAADTTAKPAKEPASDIAASEPDTRSARLDRFCPDATASRIKRHNGRCSTPGRVYTRDDIDRTGATTAGDALSKLDPSIGRGF